MIQYKAYIIKETHTPVDRHEWKTDYIAWRAKYVAVDNGGRSELQRMKDRLKPVNIAQKEIDRIVNEFEAVKLKKSKEIVERRKGDEHENENNGEFGKLTLRKTETAKSNVFNKRIPTERGLESKCQTLEANDFKLKIKKNERLPYPKLESCRNVELPVKEKDDYLREGIKSFKLNDPISTSSKEDIFTDSKFQRNENNENNEFIKFMNFQIQIVLISSLL